MAPHHHHRHYHHPLVGWIPEWVQVVDRRRCSRKRHRNRQAEDRDEGGCHRDDLKTDRWCIFGGVSRLSMLQFFHGFERSERFCGVHERMCRRRHRQDRSRPTVERIRPRTKRSTG